MKLKNINKNEINQVSGGNMNCELYPNMELGQAVNDLYHPITIHPGDKDLLNEILELYCNQPDIEKIWWRCSYDENSRVSGALFTCQKD